MFARLARLIGCALLVSLATQPLPFINLGGLGSAAAQCCKDNQACCCRRSHGSPSGPALTPDTACATQCHVPVRSITAVAEVARPAEVQTGSAACADVLSPFCGNFVRTRREASLYQRPPPEES